MWNAERGLPKAENTKGSLTMTVHDIEPATKVLYRLFLCRGLGNQSNGAYVTIHGGVPHMVAKPHDPSDKFRPGRIHMTLEPLPTVVKPCLVDNAPNVLLLEL